MNLYHQAMTARTINESDVLLATEVIQYLPRSSRRIERFRISLPGQLVANGQGIAADLVNTFQLSSVRASRSLVVKDIDPPRVQLDRVEILVQHAIHSNSVVIALDDPGHIARLRRAIIDRIDHSPRALPFLDIVRGIRADDRAAAS